MNANCFCKAGILGILLPLLTTHARAQGVVLFANQPLPRPPERRIFMPDMTTPVSGTDFMAQLLYQNNAGTWVAHPGAARFFDSSLTFLRGFWAGGNRTLVGAGGSDGTGGSFDVLLQVRVWDATGGRTFDQAQAVGVLWGTSAVFVYNEEFDVPAGTDDKWMRNFTGFSWIPEPSVLGLVALGLTALVFQRSKARP